MLNVSKTTQSSAPTMHGHGSSHTWAGYQQVNHARVTPAPRFGCAPLDGKERFHRAQWEVSRDGSQRPEHPVSVARCPERRNARIRHRLAEPELLAADASHPKPRPVDRNRTHVISLFPDGGDRGVLACDISPYVHTIH